MNFMNLTKAFIISSGIFLISCSSTPQKSTEVNQATQSAPLNEQYRNDYKKAISDLDAKKYDQASAALNQIMKNNTGFAEGWANLGLAELHGDNIAKAKSAANNALKLEPESAALYNLLGLIAVANGAFKEAEQHYARALQINPNFSNTQYNLGLLNDLYYQNLAQAIQHYERYLALINTADPDTEAWVAELKRNLQ